MEHNINNNLEEISKKLDEMYAMQPSVELTKEFFCNRQLK